MLTGEQPSLASHPWQTVPSSEYFKGPGCNSVDRVLVLHAKSPWVGPLAAHELRDVKARGPEVHGHPWLHSEFRASLGHIAT